MKKLVFGVQCMPTVRLQQFLGKNSREQIMCFACIQTASGQEVSMFSMCCRTGEFLFDFLKVIITANVFLASFTDLNLPRLDV